MELAYLAPLETAPPPFVRKDVASASAASAKEVLLPLRAPLPWVLRQPLVELADLGSSPLERACAALELRQVAALEALWRHEVAPLLRREGEGRGHRR